MVKKLALSILCLFLCFKSVQAQTVTKSAAQQTASRSGTGFFINNDGVIVTCAHVIENAVRITVIAEGEEYPARILALNNESDIAVLRIDYRSPRHFKITSFDTVSLGDRISILGFPLANILGSDIRFTEGSISARNGIESNPISFQHSAPTQSGNSGGPIINSNFEVIGVAASVINDELVKRTSGTMPQNINFGIKSDYIRPLINTARLGQGNVRNVTEAASATVMVLNYNNTQRDSEPIEYSGPSVTIVNQTGYAIYYVYVSPATDETWGRDRLNKNQVLRSGQSITVKLPKPLRETNKYDIMLEDLDGDTYTKRNITVYENGRIIFTINDFDF